MAKLSLIQPLERIGPIRIERTVWDGTAGVAVEIFPVGHDDTLEFMHARFVKTNAAAGAQTLTIEDSDGNDITDAMDINVGDAAIVIPTTVDDATAVVLPSEGAQALPSAAVANTGILWTYWARLQPV